MKVKIYLVVSFLVSIFLIFSIGIFAQDNAPADVSRGFINHWDKNNDGKVSKDEFDGPADHFTTFDKDGDGSISATEAPTGPPPRAGDSSGPGGTDGERGFMSRWDINDDGSVSKEEFGGPDNHFTNFDKNGDGSIEASEAPTGPPPRSGGSGSPGGTYGKRGFIDRWDKNDDGKVSKEEFDGPDDCFTNFDKNGDGSIETSEAPTGPPPRSGGPGGGGAGDERNR